MDISAAGQVLWVRAVETTAQAAWTEQDAEQASRSALQAVGSSAPAEDFIVQRARSALQRMAQRAPALASGPPPNLWRSHWLWTAMAVGVLAGVLADRIGSSQRINLLAPPVWVVIVWNLLVYAGLLWQALASHAGSGLVIRAVAPLQRRWRASKVKASGQAGAVAQVWSAFVPSWSRHAAPLASVRMAMCLHAAAAALALGLLGGMYLRGLVLDYRAGWQSTFLKAEKVQAVLSTLLAPATAVTGIAVPDVAGMRALQVQPGAPTAATASAADWIHLYAAQLMLLVVLPRAALALCSGRRARTLSRDFALPLDEPYFERLRAYQRGDAQHIGVWPYAHTPDVAAQAGLQAVFKQAYGADTQTRLAPTVAFGGEDDWQAAVAHGELAVALFDLSATPEAENHGRFVQRLAASNPTPVLMLIDQAGFARRFDAGRLRQRRQAWQALADTLHARAVFVDLQSPDVAAAESALLQPHTT
jgi:Protein of unknown function (DUF2868)